jgi:hypothetical protein
VPIKEEEEEEEPFKRQVKPICHLLALLGAHHILHFSRIRVNNPASVID